MAFKQFLAAALSLACVLVAGAAMAAQPVKIVAFGDSLMAGYQLAPGESFPEKLQQAIAAKGHQAEIVAAGVSGDTSSGGLARLDWSVPPDADIVLLELGANDMLRAIPPSLTRQNLTAMIEALRARGARVLLIGMRAAPNLGPDYASGFDPIYPDLASRFDIPLYPFFLEGVAGNSALQLGDGMHPNAAGVDRMVEGVMPLLEPMLAKAD
jgi:acyl-CoA thioesterase-1